MDSRPLLAVATLLLALGAASPAPADCITSRVSCTGLVNTTTDTAAPSFSQDCSQAELVSSARFDVLAGTVYAEARSSGRHTYTETARANLADEFTVSGPPAGTHLTLTAVGDMVLDNVRVEGLLAIPTLVDLYTPPLAGTLQPTDDAFGFVASAPGEESAPHQLRVAIAFVVGQPVEVDIEGIAQAATGEGGFASGKLSFEGLPPGSTIASCKGYRQDQPVPALARSWGSVKATYR